MIGSGQKPGSLLLLSCFFSPLHILFTSKFSFWIYLECDYFSPLRLLCRGPCHWHVFLILFQWSKCFSWSLSRLFFAQQPNRWDRVTFLLELPGVPISLRIKADVLPLASKALCDIQRFSPAMPAFLLFLQCPEPKLLPSSVVSVCSLSSLIRELPAEWLALLAISQEHLLPFTRSDLCFWSFPSQSHANLLRLFSLFFFRI